MSAKVDFEACEGEVKEELVRVLALVFVPVEIVAELALALPYWDVDDEKEGTGEAKSETRKRFRRSILEDLLGFWVAPNAGSQAGFTRSSCVAASTDPIA